MEGPIIYGPILSRRLGTWKNNVLVKCAKSLGVNLSKYPVCSFDCIYCSMGEHVALKKSDKSAYFSLAEVEQGLIMGFEKHLKRKTKIDYISFVGWTEPTLCPHFDKVVDLFFKMKQKYYPQKSTAIFTNSTTLNDKTVKKALKKFDRTFFKLDAVSDKIFQVINRPAKRIKLRNIIDNLIEFSNKTNKVELSTMILKVNYKDIASQNYINALGKIKPKDNKIYLCTPDWLRPTNKGKGISLMPGKKVLDYVKNYLVSFGYKVLISPPKRIGLHPLAELRYTK